MRCSLLNIFFNLLFVFVVCNMQAQKESYVSEDTTNSFFKFNSKPYKKYVVGFEASGAFLSIRDSISRKFNRISVVNWEPHFSYYFSHNIGVGVLSKIEHYQSNFAQTDPTKLELGLFIRKFLPFKLNRPFFDNFSYSIEFSFSKANYFHINKSNETIYINNFRQSVIRIPLIVSFAIFHDFNLRLSYRYVNYIKQFDRSEFSFGFEYQFIKG